MIKILDNNTNKNYKEYCKKEDEILEDIFLFKVKKQNQALQIKCNELKDLRDLYPEYFNLRWKRKN